MKSQQASVYVMSRGDGWHKVGCSVWPARRRMALSLKSEPVTLVRQFPVSDIYAVEWLAHYELRGVERSGEWFNAPDKECCRAIRRAIKKHDELGRHGLWELRAREVQRRRKAVKSPPRPGEKGRKPTPWPSVEVENEWRRRWKSKNYKSDAAVVREAKEAGFTERMVRRFGKSGRT